LKDKEDVMLRLLSRLLSGLLALALVACQTMEPAGAPQPQPKQALVNGVNLTYIEQGQGTPVVFVHGAISDWRSWELQRPAFAKKHRYIAYTQRYFGTEAWPDDGKKFSVVTHAADLAAFIRALNLGPVHLVGWSYGGPVTALVAIQDPDLVRSLTIHEPSIRSLIADSAEGKQALADFGKAAGPAVAAAKSGDTATAAKLLLEAVFELPRGGYDTDPVVFRNVILDNARTVPLLLVAPPPPVSCARLNTIKTPTLVTRGAKAMPYYALMSDEMVRCVPGSKLVVVPNSNHDSPQRNPAAFNEAVLSFLEKH
jgi:pimeloyl-ACP methyl ester carboxylesterase